MHQEIDGIAEIEAGLAKLKAYGDQRYQQGVADERARVTAAIQTPVVRKPLTRLKPASKPVVDGRIRAPRGLAAEMVDRAYKDMSLKRFSSITIGNMAKTPLEKMVSGAALRNELRRLRDANKCEFRDGFWYRKTEKK